MIRRLYIHNFRCLENFELPLSGQSSLLLIGNNGSGKTTIGLALEILQKLARGTNRVGELVKPKDLSYGRTGVPMRFEIEVELEGQLYHYTIALESPDGVEELRVFQERLVVDHRTVFAREKARFQITRSEHDADTSFGLDWNLAILPLIHAGSARDPIQIFKQWLARVLILRPIPHLIRGESEQGTLQPDPQVTNFGAWFSGVVASAPSAFQRISEYLKQVMPDLKDIRKPLESHGLIVQFSSQRGTVAIPFEDLSDGEKCFMICALVVAANDAYGPLLCFWDEPDNYLAPSEVGHTVLALRRAFESGGQLIATSHNPEAIRRFSDENTLVLYRRSHLEPTIARPLREFRASGEFQGDLVDAMVRGDV